MHATVKKILDSGILGIGVLLENDGRPTFAPSVPDRKLEIDTLFSGIGPNFKVVEVWPFRKDIFIIGIDKVLETIPISINIFERIVLLPIFDTEGVIIAPTLKGVSEIAALVVPGLFFVDGDVAKGVFRIGITGDLDLKVLISS